MSERISDERLAALLAEESSWTDALDAGSEALRFNQDLVSALEELAVFRDREAASGIEWGTAPVMGGKVLPTAFVRKSTSKEVAIARATEPNEHGIEYRMFSRRSATEWVEVTDNE